MAPRSMSPGSSAMRPASSRLRSRTDSIISNSSLVDRQPTRTDLRVVLVPANEIAEELGDRRLANLVMLGALMQRLGTFTLDQIGQALKRNLPERHRDLLKANLEALRRGAGVAAGETVPA